MHGKISKQFKIKNNDNKLRVREASRLWLSIPFVHIE